MRAVRARERLSTCLTSAARAVCGFSICLALLLPIPILYEIVADQFEQPPIWVFETTGYSVIMIAFAASGYGLHTGHHFRVAVAAEKFPRLRAPMAILSGIMEVLFGLVLLIAGSMQASNAFQQDLRSDTLLQVPQVWPMLAFPIGGLAILLQGVAHILVPPSGEPVP